MFIVFTKNGEMHSAFSAEPISYINNPDFSVAKTQEGIAFDPQYEYSLIDGLAVRGNKKPEQLNEMLMLQNEFLATQYQRNRAKAYPSIVDQLDMLYHRGYDAWRTAIQEVKNQFPKP